MNKNILIGVCGGIAAYKSAELVRLFIKEGAAVRVMMTKAAGNFVDPLSFQALSGHPVADNLMDADQEAAMGHIELARWADAVIIAPATANTIAKLSQGFADDIVSAVCLATEAPISITPAMNRVMWQNQATQDNCNILRSRNMHFIGPGEGDLACGESGQGRMLEPADILQQFKATLHNDLLQGKKVLITAGPTREALDPVRYISNHSSGKMGYALAEAMRNAGAEVVLVSGPVSLPAPDGLTRISVTTAMEMHEAVLTDIDRENPDIFVATAAVADYRPVAIAENKIKKQNSSLQLSLTQNPDILADVAALPPANRPFCVGFAAETEKVTHYGEEKRQRKGVEMLAANRVGGADGGFGDDKNAVTLLWQNGQTDLPMMPKRLLAEKLTALIAEHYQRLGGSIK